LARSKYYFRVTTGNTDYWYCPPYPLIYSPPELNLPKQRTLGTKQAANFLNVQPTLRNYKDRGNCYTNTLQSLIWLPKLTPAHSQILHSQALIAFTQKNRPKTLIQPRWIFCG